MTRRFIPAALLAFLLVGCESSTGPSSNKLTITPTSSVIEVGASTLLTATLAGSSGTPTILWVSGDTSIATIASDGTLTGRGVGETTVRATAGGVTRAAFIEVVHAAVVSVQISPDSVTLDVGATYTLQLIAVDRRGNLVTGRGILGTSSNEAVAHVHAGYPPYVTVSGAGRAVIGVTIDGVKDSIIVRSSNPQASSIFLPDRTTVSAGEQMILPAVVLSLNGQILPNNVITWTSSDVNILDVSTSGAQSQNPTLVAMSTGVVTLTARSAEITRTMVVEVTPAGPRKWKSVSVGHMLICALNEDGQAFCAGHNGSGQLGLGVVSSINVNLPSMDFKPVVGPWRFVQISAGGTGVCGLTATGIAVCWGEGSATIDGNFQTAIPHPIDQVRTFTKVDPGARGACGTTPARQIFCWNGGVAGQPISVSPTLLATTGPVGGFSLGGNFNGVTQWSPTPNGAKLCYLETSGEAFCLGYTNDANTHPPAGALRFRDVIVGPQGRGCGITIDGEGYCWPIESWTSASAPPATVKGNLTESLVGALSMNGNQACGLTAAGRALCWDLVTGVMHDMNTTLTFTSFGVGASVGASDFCGVSVGGDLYCWNGAMFSSQRTIGGTATPPLMVARQPTR